jgi:KDO2-lipid IV(A) lauroyltransferase
MSNALIDLAYASGWTAVRHLPEPVALSFFRSFADRATERDGRGVQRLRSNYARVRPELTQADLDELVRDGMRRYFRYWCEVFRLPSTRPETILERFHPEGVEGLLESLDSGQGVVLALPHMGNWDLAGAWLTQAHGDRFEGRLMSVAERLQPESLFDRFVAYRESIGLEILPLRGGSTPVFAALSERLLSGGVVALVADRDLSKSGVDVNFFNGPARMPPGPAALAVATGARLHPVGLWYDDKGLGGCIHGSLQPGVRPDADREAAVADLVQQTADAFAADIRAHTADWHMLQRIWVDEAATESAGAPG